MNKLIKTIALIVLLIIATIITLGFWFLIDYLFGNIGVLIGLIISLIITAINIYKGL